MLHVGMQNLHMIDVAGKGGVVLQVNCSYNVIDIDDSSIKA